MLSLLLSVTAPSNSACRRLVCLCEPQSRYLGLTAHVPEEGTGLWGLLSGEPREHGQQPLPTLDSPHQRVLSPLSSSATSGARGRKVEEDTHDDKNKMGFSRREARYVQVPETRGGEEQEQEQQETSGGHAKDGSRREAIKTGFSRREPRYVQVPQSQLPH